MLSFKPEYSVILALIAIGVFECYLCLAYTSQSVQDTASWSNLSSHSVLGVRLTIRGRFFLVQSCKDLVYAAEIIISTYERRVPLHTNRAAGKFDLGNVAIYVIPVKTYPCMRKLTAKAYLMIEDGYKALVMPCAN